MTHMTHSLTAHLLLSTISLITANYVSYTPYWGWSNQIQELNVAANWAKFLNRTLLLPRYAQSRSTSQEAEPAVSKCHDNHPNCELLVTLIDVSRLRQFVPIEFEAKSNDTSPPFVVSFDIDFSQKKNRISHLIRWMEDDSRQILHAYPHQHVDNEWCQRGIKVSPLRCQRSAQELVDVNATTIHFPAFSTFTVGRIWAATVQRRDALNKQSNHYIGPSLRIQKIATMVRKYIAHRRAPSQHYNAVHVRFGDFLTEGWAKSQVQPSEERAQALFEDLDDPTLPLYIATDENTAEARNRIVDKYKNAGFQLVFTFPTYNDLLGIQPSGTFDDLDLDMSLVDGEHLTKLSKSMVEQIVCAGAEQFDGQAGSTFSGYIELVRSSALMMRNHGYHQEL